MTPSTYEHCARHASLYTDHLMPPTVTDKESERPTWKEVHAYWNHSRFSQSRKSKMEKKGSVSKLSETPNVSPLCLIHISLRALWNKLLLDFAFQWSSLMHIQFAYGRAESAPAGTLSLSALRQWWQLHRVSIFSLMPANANAFERQGCPLLWIFASRQLGFLMSVSVWSNTVPWPVP